MTPCHWTSCLLSILLPLPTHKAAHSGCWWQTVCVVVGPPCLCPSVGAYFPGWPWLALDYSRVWPVLTLGPHSAAPGVWPAASAGPRTRVTRGHRRRRPGPQGGPGQRSLSDSGLEYHQRVLWHWVRAQTDSTWARLARAGLRSDTFRLCSRLTLAPPRSSPSDLSLSPPVSPDPSTDSHSHSSSHLVKRMKRSR